MTLLHSPAQLITVTAVAGALAATGVAAAADAPVVSKQHFTAGYALVDVPGTGVRQGDWLGSKAKMVYRDVTLERGQKVRVTLRAHKGQRIRGLGIADNHRISFKALDREYAGKRSVTVRATVAPHAGDGEVTERIYALSK